MNVQQRAAINNFDNWHADFRQRLLARLDQPEELEKVCDFAMIDFNGRIRPMMLGPSGEVCEACQGSGKKKR